LKSFALQLQMTAWRASARSRQMRADAKFLPIGSTPPADTHASASSREERRSSTLLQRESKLGQAAKATAGANAGGAPRKYILGGKVSLLRTVQALLRAWRK